jgi:hypothetical protein
VCRAAPVLQPPTVPSAGIPHLADLTGKEIGTVSFAYELHEER